ncbi:pyridoxaL 5'-phosphate dependent enzyme class III family protein [Streptococcus dysgalactiae subsp. dysgalactiae]|uniref:Pyridoxal phosphate homeostasis protein n=1 Tax=Streptococcus dysgalactiae subsp. dysgalactiae TaxID=99822 RepID=A0A380JVB8_STRDY|nr:YggS family pyridoxal phosphate-dependent enzyme [Streptococcus dysgalactiae]MCB2828950.1 YggS family pyridoxal phosphate-dependent enzyme [Streptococcus dysgalactiae subsp. dysgalactiae]MCB2837037.1 YggS family pyridoxal phosphate-dependent enzyme [Streptococcus dysgalactiae subsp. dysgalactiae]MCB2842447.1 YggS family pyridoxal phosphate-dependent enzyme [Streptococcus dysgalactiae subsp. dysgalactiae]MCB2850011.1 YggS family pyridoxal phosphate-dependent enzyme [Streptococcus dysgalactiae
MDLQKNKRIVFDNVRLATEAAHRPEHSVSVIAVTKYVDSTIAGQLIDTGIEHIAENRVDKFLDKYEALKDRSVTWHLIGTLQRRKVKDVINFVDYFHALDSVKLASEIEKRADHPVKCFLQVNISEEDSKHGFKVSEIEVAIEEISKMENIQLVGLMTMAPADASQERIASIFREANQLRKNLQSKKRKNMPFTELSMGMSGDYLIAIQEGSTFVRIGTSFFH